MKNVIVLIGAPATGKSTLASKLAKHFKCKKFSFDELFPLEKLKDLPSKEARTQMIEMVHECESPWIVVDDTNHYHSMQKRYLNLNAGKTLFVYLRAEKDQIEILFERNVNRANSVTRQDIENVLKQLTEQPPIDRNLLNFNFSEIPDDICQRIIAAFEKIEISSSSVDPVQSPVNAKHELNNRLSNCIHQAFSTNNHLDGKTVSKAKREFLASLEHISFEDIEDLVHQFTQKHL